ncbi:protein stoned-A [Contarinia nasturtii]|uniref:protein stoned-A n=1 Tax=Contarinia nasturtii TaxID=265458 RepID=UPI0012D46346|nr:protein stoned-A [Contarinia nasturtii]XP_031625066.1 protein stoned-A [Contarinia nasturtii]XP_031625067.1 protein stoned-A [Contarinia nasturtii]
MLKLPKGLKKKKNKKSKKNQELFTEEELEQFKREQRAKQLAEQEEAEKQEQTHQEEQHQLHQQQQQAQSQPSASTSKPKTDDDEWSKFTQLTSGIDSILKKTQGDLNRIKEKSFFQKVAPPKPKPAAKQPENEQKPQDEQEENKPTLTEEELEEQRKLAALKEAVVELSESESESEEADDIFDTNYIDELENLPLAYVPESPEETDLGPDPFDTNFAEKVIKGPEVSKRGKKIVNIGSAVEVLTGRVENVSLNKEALKRPRRGPQNLLLSSFDQDKESIEEDIIAEVLKPEETEEKPVLTLLDDPSDVIADAPIDLGHLDTRYLEFLKKKQEEEKEAERLRREAERDEFDDLATESLTKPKSDVIVVDASALVFEPIPVEQGDWKSEFEEQAELGIVDVYDEDIGEDEDVDPFDTQFVATVVREKSIDDDDFDPRAGEEPTNSDSIAKVEPIYQSSLAVKQKDLLSGSTSDLTDLSHVPVISASESIEKEIDPFDTSTISELVQPKETEIKFLEKELLSDSGIKHSLSDPDFDPRSDEKVAQPQTQISTAERKSSLCLNINQHHQTKSVVFDVSNTLNINNGEGKKKPVTPYYTDKSIEDVNEAADISDSDFDPRAITPNQKPDLLSVGEATIDIKVLTPATSAVNQDEEFAVEDPFDTSNASALLLPGKAELKLIENEFIDTVKSTETTNVLDINSDSQELGLGGKVLTPQITLPVEDSFDDIDPFDTSFASNIAPGQAEIKILESELIHK